MDLDRFGFMTRKRMGVERRGEGSIKFIITSTKAPL